MADYKLGSEGIAVVLGRDDMNIGDVSPYLQTEGFRAILLLQNHRQAREYARRIGFYNTRVVIAKRTGDDLEYWQSYRDEFLGDKDTKIIHLVH